MKYFLLSLLLFFSCLHSFSQDCSDSTLFTSAYEAEVFCRYSKGEANSHELFTAYSGGKASNDRVNQMVEQEYQYLVSSGIADKKPKKQIRAIFQHIHDKYFRKYVDTSAVPDLFTNGHYNCVSGTAIYGILLEKLGIPYEIKEQPTHVYLVAYPGSEDILMESTSPTGYYTPTDREKQEFVAQLVNSKFITPEEVAQKGINRAFNDFFYEEGSISLVQLAGLQYYNYGVFAFNNKAYEEALANFKKSDLLYPTEKSKAFQIMALAMVLDNTRFTTEKHARYVADFANLSESEDANRYARGALGSFYEELVKRNSQMETFEACFNMLYETVQDSLLKKELAEDFYNISTVHYFNMANYFRALDLSEKAYAINPQNHDTQQLLARSLIMLNGNNTGSGDKLGILEKYQEEYPFLVDNRLYQSLIFDFYMRLTYQFFSAGDEKGARGYLARLEDKFVNEGPQIQVDKNTLGLVYAEAGAHYYRKRNYRQAKAILEKGLEFVPNHPELKARLEIVEDEL